MRLNRGRKIRTQPAGLGRRRCDRKRLDVAFSFDDTGQIEGHSGEALLEEIHLTLADPVEGGRVRRELIELYKLTRGVEAIAEDRPSNLVQRRYYW
jgi:hypothetical protein